MPTDKGYGAQVSISALMQAIVAVNGTCRQLKSELDAMSDDDDRLDDVQVALLQMSTAGSELRRVYEAVQNASDNLPLYEKLTG